MMSPSRTKVAPTFREWDEAKTRAGSRAFSIARLVLVVTLLAAPLAFGAVPPWAWASLASLAVVLLLVWAIGTVQQGTLRISWSPIYLPVAAFLIFGLVQFLGHFTRDPIATRESLLKLLTDLLFLFLATQLFATASDKTWRRFGLAVTLFAFSLSLFAILQYFSSHGLIYWSVKTASGCTFGPYVNHNHYAGLMEMLIPIAGAYVLSRREEHRSRRLLGFAVLVPIASLLLSGSRGGFISLSAEALLLGAILFRYSPPTTLRRSLAVMVTLGITTAALLFFWMDPGQISKRLATVANLPQNPEATLAERKTITQDSLRIFNQHPWTGTGLGSFEIIYPRYQSLATDVVWDHAHNDYAEALVETGLVGGVLILAGLVIFFRLAFQNLTRRLQREAGWIQLGAALGCCGLLVHSFGDFNFHIPANAAWFAMCAKVEPKVDAAPRGEA